jgi:hypothetical protein
LRNNDLNAWNFFAPTVPVLKQNQFGAAAGAPAMKNKIFVFGSYQGLTVRQQAQTVQPLVPTAAQRNGDFTGLRSTLIDPVDPVTQKPFTDAVGRPCVAGNIIATDCISPVAKKFLRFIPDSPTGTLNARNRPPASLRGERERRKRRLVAGHLHHGSRLP